MPVRRGVDAVHGVTPDREGAARDNVCVIVGSVRHGVRTLHDAAWPRHVPRTATAIATAVALTAHGERPYDEFLSS